MPNYLPDQEV